MNKTFFATHKDNFGIGNTQKEANKDLQSKISNSPAICYHTTKLKTHNGYRCPDCDKHFKN